MWTSQVEDDSVLKIGALHSRWRPADARVRAVEGEEAAGRAIADPLGPAVALTADARLRLILTPGHTPGSTTAVLGTDQGEVWFIGDTSFTAEEMAADAPTAGIHSDLAATRALQVALSSRTEGGLVLPSHDWSLPERMAAWGRSEKGR